MLLMEKFYKLNKEICSLKRVRGFNQYTTMNRIPQDRNKFTMSEIEKYYGVIEDVLNDLVGRDIFIEDGEPKARVNSRIRNLKSAINNSRKILEDSLEYTDNFSNNRLKMLQLIESLELIRQSNVVISEGYSPTKSGIKKLNKLYFKSLKKPFLDEKFLIQAEVVYELLIKETGFTDEFGDAPKHIAIYKDTHSELSVMLILNEKISR